MGAKEKTVKILSDIAGLFLVVKSGFEQMKIPVRVLSNLFLLVRDFRKLEETETHLKPDKADLKKRIVTIAAKYPGLAALETKKDQLRTLIFESVSTETVYNPELLKKSLGVIYSNVVTEDLKLTILLTPKYPKEELIQFVKKFFGDEETYKKTVTEKIIPTVDETKLNQLVEQKKVELLEGAAVINEDRSWTVKTIKVKK